MVGRHRCHCMGAQAHAVWLVAMETTLTRKAEKCFLLPPAAATAMVAALVADVVAALVAVERSLQAVER